jgi:D-glycero-D-manno-heptose 1,7-bisphosphate phosphatase
MRPAIFLDRDGVIIENRPGYVLTWEDVSLIPGALEALARISTSHFQVVIVTNQAGIGHGLISPATAGAINQRLLAQIQAAGGRVDGLYVCPHTPADRCTCRKPQPGLLLQAARDLDIDLARSLLVGDALSDIQAARAAGVGTAALVLTGRGSEQALALQAAGLENVPVFRDLKEALETLVPGG